jgi:hypothetical protein
VTVIDDISRLKEHLDPTAGYAPSGEARPLLPYATLTAIFNVGVGAVLLRAGRVPRMTTGDLVLIGVATQRISRTITRDKVTSFVRAPFTRFQRKAGHGELDEAPRGSGARYAIGELLVCPYCLSTWVAGGFVAGMAFSPRRTRAVAGLFSAVAVADVLQLGYRAAEARVEREEPVG